MKKTICLLLVILLCLPLMSCDKKIIIVEEEDTFDFSNFIFEIFQGSYYEIVPLMPKQGETASGDRLLERYEEIKNNTGLVIDVTITNGIAAQVLSNLVSGTSKIDLVNDRGRSIYDMFSANAVYHFDDIDVDDCDDLKWGPDSLNDEVTFGGDKYGFFPYYWDIAPRVGGMILCDLEGIANAGMTDPHEYIEQGEWNWAAFREELQKGTFVDENGMDHYGLAVDYAYEAVVLSFTAIYSNNSKPIINNNGRYLVNLSDSKSVEALEFLREIFREQIARLTTTGEFYKDGPCPMIFYMNPEYQSNIIINSYIPFPYGPSGDSKTVSSVLIPSGSHGTNLFYAFPLTSHYNAEELGYIADMLFSPLDPTRPSGWKSILAESIFHNENDIEYYVNNVENVNVINAELFNESYEDVFEGLNSILHNNETTGAVLTAIEPIFQNDLDKIINK